MSARQVRECCKLDAEGKGYLEYGMQELNFSGLGIPTIHERSALTLADYRSGSFKALELLLDSIQ